MDCAGSTLECIATGTTIEQYNAYLKTMVTAGFVENQASTVGGNRFATYADDTTVLTVNYLDYDHSVRIFSAFRENAVLPGTGTFLPEQKITDSSLTVLALNYEAQNVQVGNNGLAFVYTLEDGSFLIYDGGNEVDAELLYAWLKKHNLRADGRIVIAGWVITHSHADHYGCFKKFSMAYGKQVELEKVIACPALHYRYAEETDDNFLMNSLESCTDRFFGSHQIIYPHMGQQLWIRNAMVEILMTAEDTFPYLIEYGNEFCMVSRVHLAGKTVMMFGDAENAPVDWLIKHYEASLNSDLIQVPHHGNGGGTKELYRLVDADISIFPTSEVSYDKYTMENWKDGANYFLITEVVKQSYHAGQTFTLRLRSL